MTAITEIPTPALLLDLDALEANLERMAAKAQELGVALRPHIKTHKCIEIAERQRALGARGVTVSTLYEARVFADHGFDDITWAFPIIHNRVNEMRELAERVRLRLTVDSLEAVELLDRTGFPFHVWLKVDCGYHRAGVDPDSNYALTVARSLFDAKRLVFDGILSHSGQAYAETTQQGRRRVAESERHVMAAFAQRLGDAGMEVPGISVGSTPTITAAEDLSGITEIRPGNYALFDYSQVRLGTCEPKHCAATLVASVVSCQPGATHAVVDAGALALSKDPGHSDPEAPSWGEIFQDYRAGTLHTDTRLVKLSQEHGVVNAPLPVGSRLRILPNHSCLTTAHFDQFHVVRGDEVVDLWKIWRGREVPAETGEPVV